MGVQQQHMAAGIAGSGNGLSLGQHHANNSINADL